MSGGGSQKSLRTARVAAVSRVGKVVLKREVVTVVVFVLMHAVASVSSAATAGTDVTVINDNNNLDGGTPNPGFDAQNRQSNETSVAISPANPNIVVVGAND